MSIKSTYLTDELYHYLQMISLRPHPVMEELMQKNMQHPKGNMQIAPEQAQFMYLLIKLMNAKRTIEIGVFTGYSALTVALALPESGEIIACDLDKQITDFAREYWKKAKVEHKIKVRLGPAEQTLQQLITEHQDGQFDFAFIDADKLSNEKYYELCLQLLRPRGVIMIDNVLMHGGVLLHNKKDKDSVAIRELNLKLLHDDRVDISMVPIGDGITLALKREEKKNEYFRKSSGN